jgi:ACT domain-containing protein
MAIIKNQHGQSETKSKNGRPKKTKSGVKINNKTGKAETGRPPLIPDEATREEILNTEQVRKLIQACEMDYNESESCAHAKISWHTFKKYKDQNPEFLSIIEDAQSTTARLARSNIFQKIASGDEKTAQWYLERKRRNEFAIKTIEQQIPAGEGPTSLIDIDLSGLSDQEVDLMETLLNKAKPKELDNVESSKNTHKEIIKPKKITNIKNVKQPPTKNSRGTKDKEEKEIIK